jgi:hypothetical protein
VLDSSLSGLKFVNLSTKPHYSAFLKFYFYFYSLLKLKSSFHCTVDVLRSTSSCKVQHDGSSDGFNDNVCLLEDSDNDGVVEGLGIGADEVLDDIADDANGQGIEIESSLC